MKTFNQNRSMCKRLYRLLQKTIVPHKPVARVSSEDGKKLWPLYQLLHSTARCVYRFLCLLFYATFKGLIFNVFVFCAEIDKIYYFTLLSSELSCLA